MNQQKRDDYYSNIIFLVIRDKFRKNPLVKVAPKIIN